MEELENRGGTCKVIKAQTKKILLLSPKKFVTAVERRWIVNDDGSRTYCLIHQGLEDQPFVPGGCSGVALGGCLWLEPLEKGEQCKVRQGTRRVCTPYADIPQTPANNSCRLQWSSD